METPAQADFLQYLGCDELQGFLFGRPSPADQFATLLEQPAHQVVMTSAALAV